MVLAKRDAIMKLLFLASNSERRSSLLTQLGLQFQVLSPTVEELEISAGTDAQIIKTVEENALRKAQSVQSTQDGLIISGDTLVVTRDNQVLGKPQTDEEAFDMLQQLNGTWHRVISAVAVIDTTTENSSVSHIWSRVHFHNLSPEVIRQYISTNEPIGKAGGYAIQGLGGFLVEEVEGSFTAVVGMPFELLVPLLSEFGVQIWHYWKS
jgi:septum formation protein